MGNGKMSSIRLTSNSTYGMYNHDGTLKVEGKKELKKYLKIKEQEQKSGLKSQMRGAKLIVI